MLTTHLIVHPPSFVNRTISILHFSLSTYSVISKLTTSYKQSSTKTQTRKDSAKFNNVCMVNDFMQFFFKDSKFVLSHYV